MVAARELSRQQSSWFGMYQRTSVLIFHHPITFVCSYLTSADALSQFVSLLKFGIAFNLAGIHHHTACSNDANLEDAQLRDVTLARGKGNILMIAKKLRCSFHRLAYHFSSSWRITPSVMGLSASPKALALYWMQSIVRFSLPVFFSARLPSGATRTMVPSLTGNISPST